MSLMAPFRFPSAPDVVLAAAPSALTTLKPAPSPLRAQAGHQSLGPYDRAGLGNRGPAARRNRLLDSLPDTLGYSLRGSETAQCESGSVCTHARRQHACCASKSFRSAVRCALGAMT